MENTLTKQDHFLNDVLKGNNCLLTGGGGVGKTYTVNQAIGTLIRKKKNIAMTASTGIAATVQDFGTTIHRWAGIGTHFHPRHLNAVLDSDIFNNNRCEANIGACDILFIDEVSMFKPDQVELLNLLFQEVRGNKRPFGGMQIVFVGDFLQIPPVYKKEDDTVKPDYFWAFDSESWKDAGIKTTHLTEVKRQDNVHFINMLNDLRFGIVSPLAKAFIPQTLKNTFGDMMPVRLVATNKEVKMHNDLMLNSFRDAKRWHKPAIIKSNDRDAYFGVLSKTLAPKDLVLIEGCQVMIVRNAKDGSYANGSMGTFITFAEREVEVDHWGGSSGRVECAIIKLFSNGDEVHIPVAETSEGTYDKDDERSPFAKMWQFPLRPAYAITMHKSQGLTLDAVEIDARRIFGEAMFYVAMSRARDPNFIRVLNFREWVVKANKRAVQFYENLIHQF